MVLSEAEARNVSLIEVLMEEAEAEGRAVQEPHSSACSWTEQQIRAYFQSGGQGLPTSAASQMPPPIETTFDRWFPGLALSRTSCDSPRLRVLCFSNAGSAEDMFTSEGTGARRAPSPLLEWCRANAAECLAVQLPGRNMRLKDQACTSCQEAAAALLPVIASRLYDVPYVVVAHSVGTWVAYEFLRRCCTAGVPLPRHAFLSAMAAPDIPAAERPWRRQRDLGEEEFKDECRGWDVNELVFTAAMWPAYHPLLRADFRLFDEYEHRDAGATPFEFGITSFWGARDRRITEGMVRGWARFTRGAFQCHRVDGNHLWPQDRQAKAAWLAAVAKQLGSLV
eukprot:scaffold8.g1583.t1